MKRLTKNFVDAEFRCPCCGVIKYDMELVDKLQILRELIGTEIIVTSGYRCKLQNIKVGGYKKSYHMEGLAADIKCKKEKLDQLKEYAKCVFYDHGVGIYENHVHVDLGPKNFFIGHYM